MKKLVIIFSCFVCMSSVFAQITLTYTGKSNLNTYVQPHHILVENLTRNWSDTLYYPDTTLVLSEVGIKDHIEEVFSVFQNVPNPYYGETEFSLTIPYDDQVSIMIVDVTGRKVAQTERNLHAGTHIFSVMTDSPQMYLLHVQTSWNQADIKMVNRGTNKINRIEYRGENTFLKKTSIGGKGVVEHEYSIGDEMRYVGYLIIDGENYASTEVRQVLNGSELIELGFLLFDTTGPYNHCPDMPIFMDVDENWYFTVQIGNQCWMKQNLRTTHYADGTSIAMGNMITSDTAFCYYPQNNPLLVDQYGLFYNWMALSRGYPGSNANPSNMQGVCPDGWHLPSESEWRELVQTVNNESSYNCCNCDVFEAKALANNSGWASSEGACLPGTNQYLNNTTGFSAMPTGLFYSTSEYSSIGYAAFFATTTRGMFNGMNSALISSIYDDVQYTPNMLYDGYSVRCLRGSAQTPTASVAAITWSGLTDSTVVLLGNVIDDGGDTVTERGFCWDINSCPSISNNHVDSGSGTGVFQYTMTDLQAGQVLYVRAYAINSSGIAYGPQKRLSVTFPPVVTTDTVSVVTGTTVLCGGEVVSDGYLWTERGFCWSTSPNPTIAGNHIAWGGGMGHYSMVLMGLSINTTYYLRAYASNGMGVTYGEERVFTTLDHDIFNQPCPSTATVTDHDGNVYNTVQIGSQCWLKENMRATQYSDGQYIPMGNGMSYDTAYRYYPNGDSSNLNLYGYLYNWHATMRLSDSSDTIVQGICPTGWHIPSNEEWVTLKEYAETVYQCGENFHISPALASNWGWTTSNSSCSPGYDMSTNDQLGFSAAPAGACVENGLNSYYWNLGLFAMFWTKESIEDEALYYSLYNDDHSFNWDFYPQSSALSVRCIKNK